MSIFGKLPNGLTPHDYQERAAIKALKQPSLISFAPGLGKTLTALIAGMVYQRKTKRKVIVIAPPSVVENWKDEAKNLVDDIVVFSSGKVPAASAIHYKYFLIVDEAHAFQNHDSRRTQKLYALADKADRSVLLTATPMRNYPSNLYPLLKLLGHNLGKLSYAQYLARYCNGKISGSSNERDLYNSISPYFIYESKDRLNLPPLTEKIVPVEFVGKQKLAFDKVFESIKNEYITRKKEAGEMPKHHHLTVLHQLRQATSIIKSMMATKIAQKYVKQGKQVIIFTNYLKSIEVMNKRLERDGIRTSILTGGVTKKNRHKRAIAFQNGESDVWLGTIQASGAGINLFKACVVIFVDRTFSPADIEQAVSRAHRQGQMEPVLSVILQDKIVDTWVDGIVARKFKSIQEILHGTSFNSRYLVANDVMARQSLDMIFA